MGGREPGPGELFKGEGEEGRAAGATRLEGQEGRPRTGRKLGSLSAKQEEQGEQEREREGEERRTGRPASSPSRCDGPALLRAAGSDPGGPENWNPGSSS